MYLVLDSFGTALRTEEGCFVVEHPTDGRRHFSPDQVRSISVGRGVRLTSDALLLAVRHEIDVVLTGPVGTPAARLWSARYGSIATIRRQQLPWSSGPAGAAWVVRQAVRKAEGHQAVLHLLPETALPQRPRTAALGQLEGLTARLEGLDPAAGIAPIAATLRGLEGQAASVFFQTLGAALPEGFRFARRERRPALTAFNVLLNYAYGVLYGLCEGALIRAGLDPYVGVLHRDDYNRPSLAYDFIEAYRAWADVVVVNLCLQQAPTEACFEPAPPDQGGGQWLSPTGRRLLLGCLYDYLAEPIPVERRTRARQTHLQDEAHALAQAVLGK